MPSKFPIWIEGVWVFEPLLLPSRSALAGSWSLALKLGLKPRHFGMGCRCFTFRLNVCPMHLNTIYICSAWHDVFMYVYIEEWLKLMEVCTVPHAYIFKKTMTAFKIYCCSEFQIHKALLWTTFAMLCNMLPEFVLRALWLIKSLKVPTSSAFVNAPASASMNFTF